MVAPIGMRDLREDGCLDIMISDDFIGMMIYEDSFLQYTELWVWNWKTGEVKLVSLCSCCYVQTRVLISGDKEYVRSS